MTDCIFCKIIQGSAPSIKVYENENCMAFMDIIPAVKGHVLVIPKAHYETFLDIPLKEVQGLIKVVHIVALAVNKALKPQGYKIEMFNKKIAGQGVPHAHFHIIPRDENDGLELRADKTWWVPNKDLYKRGEIEQYAQRIKEFL